MFAQAAGIELTHATYRGDAPGIQDLLGGQVASSVNNIGVVLPHLKSGKLRVLATSGAKRSAFTSNVPTFTEAGFKEVQAQEWFGFVMPSKVGKPVVDAFAKAVEDVAQKFGEFSFEPVALKTDEFAALLKNERERWATVVKASGFRIDE
jgi:tripartite-type tricarboxylate transporter receptor subunit TctC